MKRTGYEWVPVTADGSRWDYRCNGVSEGCVQTYTNGTVISIWHKSAGPLAYGTMADAARKLESVA